MVYFHFTTAYVYMYTIHIYMHTTKKWGKELLLVWIKIANSEDPDQAAHPRNLVRISAIRKIFMELSAGVRLSIGTLGINGL